MTSTYLADTSAWLTSRRDVRLSQWMAMLLATGRVATCHPVVLELLRSTHNAREFSARRLDLHQLPHAVVDERTWTRALDVNEQLAQAGGSHHRSVGHPDLLIAAAAELAGHTLLHYDADFDAIAAVTGQPTEWIAPRGTL